jgi:hypothetical protein
MQPLLIYELGSTGVFALGLLVLYGAVIQRRKKSLIQDIPTSKVRSVAVGMTEVKGEPVPRDKPLESPFSDTECIAYVYSVDRYNSGGRNSSSGWKTVEAGVKAPEFYVDDGTGRILVDPEGAEKEFSTGNEYRFEDETEDESIKRFMEERDGLFENPGDRKDDDSGIISSLSNMAEMATASEMRVGDATALVGSGEKRRYTEEFLPADTDQIYVFGRAERRDDAESSDNSENLVLTRNANTPLFKISDKPEDEVVSETGNTQIGGMVFGFVVTVAGFGATLYTAGYLYGTALLGLGAFGAYKFNEKFTMQKDPDASGDS